MNATQINILIHSTLKLYNRHTRHVSQHPHVVNFLLFFLFFLIQCLMHIFALFKYRIHLFALKWETFEISALLVLFILLLFEPIWVFYRFWMNMAFKRWGNAATAKTSLLETSWKYINVALLLFQLFEKTEKKTILYKIYTHNAGAFAI